MAVGCDGRFDSGCFTFGAKQGDLGFEIFEGIEASIHRRESQVRNFV
jgi:hypothetical protein